MISTKGRYALRVMLDLAQQPEHTYTPLKEIAVRQEISEKYLEIILKNLVKEKFLRGLRGKGGGYQLTRPPEGLPGGGDHRAGGRTARTRELSAAGRGGVSPQQSVPHTPHVDKI